MRSSGLGTGIGDGCSVGISVASTGSISWTGMTVFVTGGRIDGRIGFGLLTGGAAF
jgi:hypothetical protein